MCKETRNVRSSQLIQSESLKHFIFLFVCVPLTLIGVYYHPEWPSQTVTVKVTQCEFQMYALSANERNCEDLGVIT